MMYDPGDSACNTSMQVFRESDATNPVQFDLNWTHVYDTRLVATDASYPVGDPHRKPVRRAVGDAGRDPAARLHRRLLGRSSIRWAVVARPAPTAPSGRSSCWATRSTLSSRIRECSLGRPGPPTAGAGPVLRSIGFSGRDGAFHLSPLPHTSAAAVVPPRCRTRAARMISTGGVPGTMSVTISQISLLGLGRSTAVRMRTRRVVPMLLIAFLVLIGGPNAALTAPVAERGAGPAPAAAPTDATLSGQLRDATSLVGVPGQLIFLTSPVPLNPVPTDANGNYSVLLGTGDYLIEFTAGRCLLPVYRSVHIDTSQPHAQRELELDPGHAGVRL